MANTNEIDLALHSIGRHTGVVAMYHDGEDDPTADQIQEMQKRATNQFKLLVEKSNITGQDTLDLINALEKYDWRDAQSYGEFRKVFDNYIKAADK
ncbi:hypothetical protein HYZ41_02370 [archaeon]|nr:hypothetical protein [archaeon]